MIKQAKFTFRGMNQDISKYKHPGEFYYSGKNIRIISTGSQSTGAVTNEKGNELSVSLPNITINTDLKLIQYLNSSIEYTNGEIDNLSITNSEQIIIGHTITRNSIILFSTNNEGFDCVWEIEELLDGNFNLELLYCRDLQFSINNPIQALFNYENDIIQKVYWVDGKNQVRFLNIKHSIENNDAENLIDLNSTTINFVGNFNLTEPIISDVSFGGTHTSGKIQYAYNLYKLNSSQTTISPLSKLIPLDKGNNNGGGEINEVVGSAPIININNLDPNYSNIRIYAIKYTSYNQIPSVSLIYDQEYNNSDLTYFDDGSIISSLTLEEFIFLGSSPIIPRHIESKDNRLFYAGITENNFDVNLDTRAYSFAQVDSSAFIYDNVRLENDIVTGDLLLVDPTNYDVPLEHDAVNLNYDLRAFQPSSSILGGEGKYIKYELTQSLLDDNTAKDNRFFKSNEIYRIGIQFYNKLGQKSLPKWIADFKAPKGNLDGNYNTLNVTLKPEFYVWLNTSSNFESENDIPVGYKIIRADRKLIDRTILYQGVLSPMIFQIKGNDAQTNDFPIDVTNFQDENIKIPSYFIRNFEDTMELGPDLGAVNGRGKILAVEHANRLNSAEIHTQNDASNKLAQTFQFTKMMQLHTPEVQFDFISNRNNLNLSVNGLANRTAEAIKTSEIFVNNETEKNGGKFEFFPTRQFIEDNNMSDTFNTPLGANPRYIGPSGNDETVDFTQIYREYNDFTYGDNNTLYPIYGSPEITERGQGNINYNGDARYNYSNSLESWLSDGEVAENTPSLTSFNSWSTKTVTLMLGDQTTSTNDRIGLEDIYNQTSNINTQGILSVDITIPRNNIYLNNIYGGNSYESKERTLYIEIGNYSDINNNNIDILSPGDTFIFNYKFLRIGKTDTEVLSTRVPQVSEIISYPVETNVDLKNRNDLSLFNWDNIFQPRDNQYHIYNRVYSQQSNLIENTSQQFNFKKVEIFDNRILSSKLKTPGEEIDSWTDILINEEQDLDGKYGPINCLVNFKDQIYALQDEGVALLSINPRIQVQGSDGVDIELGRGSVLYDYNYITTKSGTVNKWSVTSSPTGFYYFDLINKSWNKYSGQIEGLSDKNGMHDYFINNINYNDLKIDNPIIGKGVVGGYDLLNNDSFLTILQNDKENLFNNFTLSYNEMSRSFVSFYSYTPSRYINKGFRLLTTNPDNTRLYEQGVGLYNLFYNEYKPSIITLMLNPESDLDCIFNNIMYKSELYLNDIDLPTKTLTSIRGYNEYQDSGKIPLILNKNIRRKFRKWQANIPRNKDSRDRLRNPYIFLELELENLTNYKMILHDIIVSYSV